MTLYIDKRLRDCSVVRLSLSLARSFAYKRMKKALNNEVLAFSRQYENLHMYIQEVYYCWDKT